MMQMATDIPKICYADEGKLNMRCGLKLIAIGFLVSAGFLSSALSLEYSNHLLHLIRQNEVYLSETSMLLSAELSISIALVLGCLGSWIPLQYLGRRCTLELLSAPLLILGCCFTFTYHHIMLQSETNYVSDYTFVILFLGLCLQGISCGLIFVASPVYILETIGKVISTSSSIGTLLLSMQMSTTVGLLLANAFPLTNKTHFCHLIPATFSVVSLIGFSFLPESPIWLLLKEKQYSDRERAFHIMKRSKRDDITLCLQHVQTDHIKFKKDQSIITYLHPLLLVVGLCFIWHLYGVHVYEFYTSWTLKFAGISMKWKLDATLLSLCIRFSSLSALIAMYLIVSDITFHTTFFIYASGVVTLSLTVTGLCFYSFEEETSWVTYLCWIPLTAFLLFQCAFWLGPGSQVYIIGVVISPQSFRPSFSSVGAAIFWAGDILSSRMVMPMISILNPFGSFWLFAGMSAISLIFLLFSVFPELHSKDKSDDCQSLCKVAVQENNVRN